MKPKFDSIRILPLAFAGLLAVLAGCNYKGPDAIWNPIAPLGIIPEILRVDPSPRAEPGVFTIALRGLNFGSDTSKIDVYFNSTQVLIKSRSDSVIVVYRPNIIGDDITIKVSLEGAAAFGKFSGYSVAEAARLYGKLPQKSIISMLAVDKRETLYALKNNLKDFVLIDTAETQAAFGNRTIKNKSADMKVGPDGGLYITEKKSSQLYRVPPEGGSTEPFAMFAANVHYIDYDINGNLFGAGEKTGISVLLPDLTSRVVGNASDLTVVCLHVYNNAVYVADGTTIWRSEIQDADGSLGKKTKIFNIAAVQEYAASKILSFVLDANGVFYIATDHADAVFLYYPDGTTEPLYKGLLPKNSGQLVWGNGNHLFLTMVLLPKTNDIMRFHVGANEAPKQ